MTSPLTLLLSGSCKMSVPPASWKEVMDLQHDGLVFRVGSFALVVGVTVLGGFNCIWSLCDQMLHTVQS